MKGGDWGGGAAGGIRCRSIECGKAWREEIGECGEEENVLERMRNASAGTPDQQFVSAKENLESQNLLSVDLSGIVVWFEPLSL